MRDFLLCQFLLQDEKFVVTGPASAPVLVATTNVANKSNFLQVDELLKRSTRDRFKSRAPQVVFPVRESKAVYLRVKA
jgi:hypothetical protein